MTSQEKKAILACKNGDFSHFSTLYDMYIKKIYSFVFYKTNHKETAEDLTSTVFMKALNSIKSFDVEVGTLQAWLYMIARNTIIDHYRTKKSDANIEDCWDLSDKTDLSTELDSKIKLEKVAAYLKNIKSDQRDIIIMRVWQGMSHAEIAEVLGKSEASVKMKYSRAISSLRKDLSLGLYVALLLFS